METLLKDDLLVHLQDKKEDGLLQNASEYKSEVELDELPLDFSFARYLSPAGKAGCPVVRNNGTTLGAVHLVALALNEKCRELRQGAFYCLLDRDKHRAHACDAVFINELWGEKGNTLWDASDWKQRLEFVQASKSSVVDAFSADWLPENIDPSEKVIPLCVRVLKYNINPFSITPESSDSGESLLTPTNEECDPLLDGKPHATTDPIS